MVKRPPRAVVAAEASERALESLARAALAEVTPAQDVGDFLGTRPGAEAGLTDVLFRPALRGYAGWSWVVTVAAVPDEAIGAPAETTVLELGLLPGDGALLAPAWVPWSVRLAEWEAQQALLAAESEEGLEDGDTGYDDADDLGLAEDDEDEDDTADLDDADLDDEFDDENESGIEADEDPDADDEDDLDLDEDTDGPMQTHGGDIDGVDIDDLDLDED